MKLQLAFELCKNFRIKGDCNNHWCDLSSEF